MESKVVGYAVTADQEYQIKSIAAKKMLELIGERIKIMDLKQKREPENWGYVGSMNHVIENLKEIYQFLGGN